MKGSDFYYGSNTGEGRRGAVTTQEERKLISQEGAERWGALEPSLRET